MRKYTVFYVENVSRFGEDGYEFRWEHVKAKNAAAACVEKRRGLRHGHHKVYVVTGHVTVKEG